jgi:predicted Zn-dependent protease
VRRGRVVLAAVLAVVVLTILVLLALPLRALAGSTLAQAAPARGGEYIVKAGDTLASIAARADASHAGVLTAQLTREMGSAVVVPGEHVFIP